MPALKDQNARPADENVAGWSALCATGRRQAVRYHVISGRWT